MLGENADQSLAGGAHGVQMAFVIAVERTLQGLGQLPVTGVVVLELADERGDRVEIHQVGQHVLVECAYVHAAQQIREIGLPCGAFAQFGRGERGRPLDKRIGRRLDVHGEPAVGVEFDVAGAVRGDERNPAVARIGGFDGGAVGAVDQAFGLEAGAAVVQPSQIDDELDLAAGGSVQIDPTAHLEPGGAPGGAPLPRHGEVAELHHPGPDTGQHLVRWLGFAGIVERAYRAMGQRVVHMRFDALLHDAVGALQLLVGHQEHAGFSFMVRSVVGQVQPRAMRSVASWNGLRLIVAPSAA